MNTYIKEIGVKRKGQFMYNAAISTTHAVTTLAIFFKLCLVIRGYIFLQPRYLHEAVSYTSVGSYVITHPAVM